MQSQRRTFLLIGGLALVGVLLLVLFLVTQRPVVAPVEVVVTPAPAAAVSPLDAGESPLAEPGPAANAAMTAGAPFTAGESLTAGAPLSETDPLTETGPLTRSGDVSLPIVLNGPAAAADTPLYTYQIVAEYPHDPSAFTQGLQYVDGELYEGTGLYGESTLRRVNLATGQVLEQVDLPDDYFGEGIVVVDDRIYQLTWQSHIGFIYDKESFEQLDDFAYPTEGWGITYDGTHLIMSDGSPTLRRWDPETLAEVDQVDVVDAQGNPVTRLNELEYIDGEVYANIWQTDRIARIDPVTGRVTGWIDLTGLLADEDVTQPVDVLNGIAYDDTLDRLFVTGKLWPKLFEIDLVAVE
jgi:glutamine cyclotransferase